MARRNSTLFGEFLRHLRIFEIFFSLVHLRRKFRPEIYFFSDTVWHHLIFISVELLPQNVCDMNWRKPILWHKNLPTQISFCLFQKVVNNDRQNNSILKVIPKKHTPFVRKQNEALAVDSNPLNCNNNPRQFWINWNPSL